MDGEGLTGKPFQQAFGRIDPRRQAPFYVSVIVSKLLRTACLFWAFSFLHHTPLAVFLCLLKMGSAIVYVLLQRPLSSGKRITRPMWFRVIRHSLLVAVTSILWTLGLSLCGALRTSLLWQHSGVALTAVLSAVASLGNSKARGALLFIFGTLSLLLFDNDQTMPPVEHPEGPHRSVVSHALYWMLSFLGVPDHKGGIVLLLLGTCLVVLQKSSGRKLSVELGGAKRLQALSTLVVAVLLVPWALVHLSTQTLTVSWSSLLICLLATSLSEVIDYYSLSIASQHIDKHSVARLGSMSAFVFSLLTAYLLWTHTQYEDHMITVGVVIATVLYLLATPILTRPNPRSGKSTLIGYSAAGLPLYQSSDNSSLLTDIIRPAFHKIMETSDSRRIFYFLLLNLAFTFVELLYGMWTNSLGLISDGFHMLFDCTALLVGLYASLMSRWKPTRLFSYGYGRVEILSGFVNGLFLVGIALFVLSEALHRVLDPPNINTDRLLVVSIAGFVVNLIGIVTFSMNASHGHSHGHGHSHNANMQGVFLHILADLMGSIGVIISSLLVQYLGWYIADPVCSLFIAVLILISVGPLLKQSADVLLLATPNHHILSSALDKLPMLDGVLTFSDAHFWQHSSESTAGTLHVQVAPSANEQKVVTMITNFLREQGVSNLTVQVEKEAYSNCNITQSYVKQLGQSTPPQVYVNYGPHTGEIKAV